MDVGEYGWDATRVMDTARVIRARPELYLGPLPDSLTLNRLVQDALCLSADAAADSSCTEIAVAVHPSGVVTIRDDGPGLPVEPDGSGRSLAEALFTVLGTCRAAKQSPTTAGCCDAGLAVVNALSEWLRVRVFRGGGCWLQEYRAGVPQAPFARERDAAETGLEVTFRPDAIFLGPLEFDALALASWLPSAGVRFGALQYRPSVAADRPTVLHFTEVGPHPDLCPAEPGAAADGPRL